MKRVIKNTIYVILWLALALGSLWTLNRVFIVKNREGVTNMQDFYAQEKNSIDVLLLGSSHCGMNLDTATLWSEYGMASYALWGSVQPFWNSYHFLVEALKTQTPKAVVLETYAAIFWQEYGHEEGQVINTAGMRPSLNKWEAVKVSAPQERWLDLFFGLPLYHERFSDLSQDDYEHFPWTEGLILDKGSLPSYSSHRTVKPAGSLDTQEVAQLLDKEEEYLRKIISLCQSRDIPILLIKTPINGLYLQDQQPYYNRVAEIAEEYGVPFCNLNLLCDEIGLSEEDFAIDDNHLNIKGARKSTLRLGQELQALCNIPDRREDPKYASWEENARQIQFPQPGVFQDTQSLIEELLRRDWTLFVATTGKLSNSAANVLSALGIPDFPAEGEKAWLLSSTQQGNWIEATQSGALFTVNADGLDVTAQITGWTWIMANGFEVSNMQECDAVLGIFDTETKQCVDVVQLRGNGLTPKHLM